MDIDEETSSDYDMHPRKHPSRAQRESSIQMALHDKSPKVRARAKEIARQMRKQFHHLGTKYLPLHPIHKGDRKEE